MYIINSILVGLREMDKCLVMCFGKQPFHGYPGYLHTYLHGEWPSTSKNTKSISIAIPSAMGTL